MPAGHGLSAVSWDVRSAENQIYNSITLTYKSYVHKKDSRCTAYKSSYSTLHLPKKVKWFR